jgi:hypothetical protein
MTDKEASTLDGLKPDPTAGLADMESGLVMTEGLAIVKYHGLGLVAGLHGNSLRSRIVREMITAAPFGIIVLLGLRKNRAQGGSQGVFILLSTLLSYAGKRKAIQHGLTRMSTWASERQEELA